MPRNAGEKAGMKPIALDLCCGKGGWTIGLQKAGWDVIGVDIEKWEGYPGWFVQGDVREFDWKFHVEDKRQWHAERKCSLVCASPPCQEFSYSSFPFKNAREKFTKDNPPDRSIWDACVRIAKELNAPLILENVRGAQKWMGKAEAHYGSFYLWGDVPVLLPIGKPIKGFNATSGKALGLNRTNWSSSGGESGGRQWSSKSKKRKEWSARAAMIPEELSMWIGECFYPERLKTKAI